MAWCAVRILTILLSLAPRSVPVPSNHGYMEIYEYTMSSVHSHVFVVREGEVDLFQVSRDLLFSLPFSTFVYSLFDVFDI